MTLLFLAYLLGVVGFTAASVANKYPLGETLIVSLLWPIVFPVLVLARFRG